MIKNNFFSIPKVKSIIIFGYHNELDKLVQIIEKFKLEYCIISSSDQSRNIKKLNYKIFDKINSRCKKFIIKNFDVDKTLFISLGSRIIFSEKTIQKFFKNNLVNFHNSRLPLDAGGGSMSWRILRNDRIDNQLVHLVDKGIDTGPIISNKNSLFPSNCIIPKDMETFSSKNFISFFKIFLTEIKLGKKFLLKNQSTYLGRYNPRLNTNINGWIDWNMNSENLVRFINAFDDPYPGALTSINKKIVRIKKVQLHDGDSFNHPFMSGLISRHDKDWLVVSTTDKSMILIEKVLNKKNKNIISELKPGDRFVTSPTKLHLAKKDRIKYNSKGLVSKIKKN